MKKVLNKCKEWTEKCPWMKTIGIAGFLFFFIKGLFWLALIFFAGKNIF